VTPPSVPPQHKTKEKAKVRKRPKKKNATPPETETISKALHEKDAAEALGDAIRARADQWRQSPLLGRIDTSVSSVGWALGASDHPPTTRNVVPEETTTDDDDMEEVAAGVEAATTSVVAHYFLKSHGGAHAVQSLCSLLATLSGLGALILPRTTYSLALLRRCMIFAMTKHLAGILAACVLTARAIPEIGLAQARQRLEDLVQDPVAQYVFYSACILFWLPAQWSDPPLWWQGYPAVSLLFTGPILLREVISTVLVISDVLLLWAYSNKAGDETSGALVGLLHMSQSVINAGMSLLVTPSTWRSADSLQRQAILARLVSRASLAFEVLVGLVLVADALLQAIALGFSAQRPSLSSVLKSLVCARLYLNFLWTRRRKIHKLATKLRGGAANLPLYVLTILLDPLEAMGLNKTSAVEA
jgi:hypothetical protein